MLILIDSIHEWMPATTSVVAGIKKPEQRRYYLADLPARALIVCRNGLELEALHGKILDAVIGWDSGIVGPARLAGKKQTKITLFRVESGPVYDRTLSSILDNAPHGTD